MPDARDAANISCNVGSSVLPSTTIDRPPDSARLTRVGIRGMTLRPTPAAVSRTRPATLAAPG